MLLIKGLGETSKNMEEKNIKIKKTARFSKGDVSNDIVSSDVSNKFVDSSIQDEPEEEFTNTSDKPKRFSKSFFIIALIVIILGFAAYYFIDYKSILNGGNSKVASSTINTEGIKILAQLGKIIVLPLDVNPVIASVTNADTLKSQQAFFTNVKNGDWLIVYPDLAIIFDAKANKIMKVGPVQMSSIPDNESSTNIDSPKTDTE